MVPFGAMENKRPRLAPENAAKIDAQRGDIPFDRWVNRLIEAFFADNRDERLDELDQMSAIATGRRRKPPEGF